MTVPFQQMNVFLINSYKPTHTYVFSGNYNLSLKNYIKSQIHLNLVGDLYGRDMKLYKGALKYLYGDESKYVEFCKVVKYFYEDISNMILNVNETGSEVDITIDTQLDMDVPIKKEILSLEDSVAEVESALNGDSSDYELFSVLKDFPLKLLSTLKPNRTIALAIKLLYYSKISDTVLLEVR